MKTFSRALRLGALGVLTLVTSVASAAPQRTTERAFAAGGTAYLDLSAGEYRITASKDGRIRIVAHSTSRHDASATSVRVDVKGTRADLIVDGPMNDGVKVDIELPGRTNIITRLSAGELSLSGIDGSKDISARAGELQIEVGAPDRYRHVEASVKAGEIRAQPFNVTKEGLFRSFEWNGRGSYDLRVSLWAGEVTLK